MIALLSSDPFIRTCFEFLLARVVADTDTFWKGFGRNSEFGILECYVSQLFQQFDGKKQV